MGGAWIMSQHITDDKSRSDLRNLHELRGKRLVAQVSQTGWFALYSRTGVVLMLQLESSCHGRSVDHVSTYSGRQSGSDLRNLHELCGKGLVAQVSQTRRFALYPRTEVVLKLQLESSWHGRSVDHVSTYFGRQIPVGSQKPSRITRQKTCCASESNTSVRLVFANQSGFDAPIGVVLAWEERGSCLNIFQTKNRGRISETFTNYEVKDLLRKSMDLVSTYSGGEIAVGSQKPSRITRQKTCCASESNTSIRVVLASRSGFDAPNRVVLALEEWGSVAWIMSQHIPDEKSRSDLRDLHELRGKRLVAQVSQTRRFANQSGFDAPIGVVLAWETFTNYESKDLLRKSMDIVSTYSERQITVGSQKPSRMMRQKTCCASDSTRRFAMYTRTGVVLMLQLESSWHGRSVDHVSTYSGR
ncbi:uncharacterized protein G2W53_033626 [Senna tora]|uniref:Uncharacterized protein n=1 Tax=Senna tora TaxID=362788 RepID=A0A834SYP7_9FABA|nr:uncharacterized protein G2W53_033626 [Senna tora]